MKDTWKEAESALKQAADKMKHFYDQRRGELINYKPGDLVLLEATNINSQRPSKKLDFKRHGPFEVLEKVGRSAYKLKLPPTWRRLYPTVNEIYLTPYQSPTFPSQQ